MTGSVPYHGGRLTPAQAYAASHPTTGGAAPVASPGRTAALAPAPAPGTPPGTVASRRPADTLDALAHLLDTGVITAAEYDQLRSRVRP
ncbi:MAG: SHOCT domain-containing protein [Dermatophilaceae bacterium]